MMILALFSWRPKGWRSSVKAKEMLIVHGVCYEEGGGGGGANVNTKGS